MPSNDPLLSRRDLRLARMRTWLRAHNPELGSAQIAEDTDLIDSGMVDSLQLIEFILFLEQECGRPILSDTVDPAWLRTLGAIHLHFFIELQPELQPEPGPERANA